MLFLAEHHYYVKVLKWKSFTFTFLGNKQSIIKTYRKKEVVSVNKATIC